MKEMIIYEVSLNDGCDWDENLETYGGLDGTGSEDTVCYNLVDAVKVFRERMSELHFDEVLVILEKRFMVEELPKDNFILDTKEFETRYGCKEKPGIREIASVYKHDDVKYQNAIDLPEEIVKAKSRYFNMRVICEEANVNYSTFRGFKNNNHQISDAKIYELLKVMNKVGAGCWSKALEDDINEITNYPFKKL